MMDARVLQLLEFHKVLRHISSFAVSEAGRDACLLLLPEKDPARIAERSGLIRELLSFSDHAELKLSFFPDVTGVFAFLSNPSAVLDQDGLIGIWAMLKIAAALKAGFGEPDPETYPLAKSLAEALVLPARTWSALGRCLTLTAIFDKPSGTFSGGIVGCIKCARARFGIFSRTNICPLF